MDQKTFEEKLDQIFIYMKKILVEKNKSYGSESFYGEGIFPVLGNCVRLRDKMSRYTNLVSKFVNDKVEYTSSEANPFGESLWDTICDIFGYACIGLCILDEKGMGSLPDSKKTLDIRSLEADYWIKLNSEKMKEATEGEDRPGDLYAQGNDPLASSSPFIAVSKGEK